MDPAEAVKVTQDPDELQDLCDDNLQTPAPEPDLAEQLTKDIQRDPPKAKKPRTKKQQEAFAKAQEALRAKRAKAKADKEARKTPKPPKSKPVPREVVYEVEESESESSSEEEVVYVQRKKPKKRQPKPKKQPRIVYITDSSDEEETIQQSTHTMSDWYNFV